eukprot:gnl/TRDRNA2_/TRDRNA2_177722_c0_seq13.p2 gnl/TRDRNA2_/TRDRNA2_177722_c0~~gnl/TRDRNA2_/TRDRNA2_177722_c0_seq13.p2  ORF type:complete len:249 (+),score=28.40 gnl/TRDRNA2_/TRDRNA2_177722_c0_seq13:706-1452(+)
MWPATIFPQRPTPVLSVPLLHSEVMIFKNSPHAQRFCDDMYSAPNIVSRRGHDMTALQHATLKFIGPRTDEITHMIQWAENITMGQESYLYGEGLWGFKGPWQPENRYNYGQLRYSYFKVTTDIMIRQCEWDGVEGGRLRILNEAELFRDWQVGPLMLGGDFIVHTKYFLVEDFEALLNESTVNKLFTKTLEASFKVAEENGYNLNTTFAKSRIPVPQVNASAERTRKKRKSEAPASASEPVAKNGRR